MDNMAFPICIHRASGGVIAGEQWYSKTTKIRKMFLFNL